MMGMLFLPTVSPHPFETRFGLLVLAYPNVEFDIRGLMVPSRTLSGLVCAYYTIY